MCHVPQKVDRVGSRGFGLKDLRVYVTADDPLGCKSNIAAPPIIASQIRNEWKNRATSPTTRHLKPEPGPETPKRVEPKPFHVKMFDNIPKPHEPQLLTKMHPRQRWRYLIFHLPGHVVDAAREDGSTLLSAMLQHL